MKLHFKKPLLLALALIMGGKLLAQSSDATNIKPESFRTWSIGIYGASLSASSPFSTADWSTQTINFGVGGYIRKQLIPQLGIQGNLLTGKLTGSGAPAGFGAYSSYSTTLTFASDINLIFTIANISVDNKQSVVQPYIMAGSGFASYKPQLTTASGTTVNFKAGDLYESYIPVGAGIKINASESVIIDLGYQINFMLSDNLDGLKFGGNNDAFSYGHLGIEIPIGKTSKQQLSRYSSTTTLQNEYMRKEKALKDQVQIKESENEQLRANLNATNASLNATNASMTKLTKDTDGDGVNDLLDKCPDTPTGTKVDSVGCPLIIAPVVTKPEVKPMSSTTNPDVKTTPSMAKPDAKTPLSVVKTPVPVVKTPAAASRVTDEDKRIVKASIKNLAFEPGKATLRSSSFPGLVVIANLMISKKYSLKLAGFTDNVGTDEANIAMSQARADAIKDYLISIGVDASKIDAFGYGKEQPVASNKTPAGREANRRVEFTLQ